MVFWIRNCKLENVLSWGNVGIMPFDNNLSQISDSSTFGSLPASYAVCRLDLVQGIDKEINLDSPNNGLHIANYGIEFFP